MMDNTTKIEKFNIDCKDCKANQKPQNAMLYVNWEKKYYMVTCLTCNNMEVFDELSKKVEIKKDEQKLQVN